MSLEILRSVQKQRIKKAYLPKSENASMPPPEPGKPAPVATPERQRRLSTSDRREPKF